MRKRGEPFSSSNFSIAVWNVSTRADEKYLQTQKVELINEEVARESSSSPFATTSERESRARAQNRTPFVSQKDLKLNPFSLVATTAVRERFAQFVREMREREKINVFVRRGGHTRESIN